MRTAWTPSSIDFTLSRFEWLNYRHKDFTLFHPKCRPTDNTITFFPSTDFEDAIRKAVSLGGDSDTLACITGGIAEAFYREIPKEMADRVRTLLPQEFADILSEMQARTPYGTICFARRM